MGCRILPAAPPTHGIHQDASANRVVERAQSRYAGGQLAYEHTHPELEFEQPIHVGDWSKPETQPVSYFQRVLLCLQVHVARKDRTLLRVIAHARDAEQIFELDLGVDEG